MPIAPPLPLVLAAGAGTVVVTAAVLSGRAARNPELPEQRWSRPLPPVAARVAGARSTRTVLRWLGLVGAAVGIVTLAARVTPADGLVVLPVVTALSLIAGTAVDLANPLSTGGPAGPGSVDLRGASVWLSLLCAVALSTPHPRALAVAAAGHLLAQAILTRRTGRRADPVGALAELLGHLAPVGRDTGGGPAWRNPLVTAAHATLSSNAVTFGAVVIAASLTHAAAPRAATLAGHGVVARAAPVLLFVALVAVVAGVLRLCVIRPFFRGAIIPLVAAYGLVAGGRWWPPADLVVFVALHALAVGVLHRQALARHDLRTARAVQFPLRVALLASVLAGLALLVGR